jgi:hypothetical protein
MQVEEWGKPLSPVKSFKSLLPEVKSVVAHVQRVLVLVICRRTFHSVFKTWMPSLSATTAIDDIFKSLGGNQLKIVVVDEVLMLSTKFIVLLDTRL